MQAMKPYTVVGVTTGRECLRVHQNVMADTPQNAICEVINQLNGTRSLYDKCDFADRLQELIYNTRNCLLGAVVFEGHLTPPRDSQGGVLQGHERQPARVPACFAWRKAFTVVTVDPASHQVAFHHLEHADVANAENIPALEFFLIGGTVPGHAIPVYVHQGAASAWPTSRDQRVMALANNYSLDYMRHLSYHAQAACM